MFEYSYLIPKEETIFADCRYLERTAFAGSVLASHLTKAVSAGGAKVQASWGESEVLKQTKSILKERLIKEMSEFLETEKRDNICSSHVNTRSRITKDWIEYSCGVKIKGVREDETRRWEVRVERSEVAGT